MINVYTGSLGDVLKSRNYSSKLVIRRSVWCASSSMATGKVRAAAAQMTSTNDLHANFLTCSRLVQQAVAAGVKFLSLPECFSFIGSKAEESLNIADTLDGPIMKKYCSLARESEIWLSLGGFQEKGPDEKHLYNTHVLVDDQGNIRSSYRKIHLFNVDIPGGPVLKESNTASPGSEVVAAECPLGKLGLTICYDLRFPELYQQLRFEHNAKVMLVPSAFTKLTGQAHWEILLRARAIERQCYVIAAAQAGRHNEKRESYGDALIIDPWGVVVARCPDKLCTGLAIADIDPSVIDSVRMRMPISEHRRTDLYATGLQSKTPEVSGNISSL